jgi:O-succinylbenzoate synthase
VIGAADYELIVVRLPLVRPFTTAMGVTTVRDVLLVRALGDNAEGWGECSAGAVAGYWHETVGSAAAALRTRNLVGQPMARAALEMADLDRTLRAQGTSLATHLGGARSAIDATATAGFNDDPDAFADAGYRSLKVKVEPGRIPPPSDRFEMVQADANGSFAGRAAEVSALDDAGFALIEQPLAPGDIAGHATLATGLRTPVCLDESISSLDLLDTALAARACQAVNVKPSRLGGIAAAREAHDRCVAAGVDAKVGGMLETGIGRAAALALASLPGFSLPADLSASARYWEHDIIRDPFALDAGGRLRVPTGPGLGVDVDVATIDACAISRERIPSG